MTPDQRDATDRLFAQLAAQRDEPVLFDRYVRTLVQSFGRGCDP